MKNNGTETARKKLFIILSYDFQQQYHAHSMGKGWAHQQVVLEKLDSHMQKNDAELLPYKN